MRIKSSHHIHLEMIERTLQPESCFQLQASQHKVLVIRDAIADDKEYCDALLLKIEHLLRRNRRDACELGREICCQRR